MKMDDGWRAYREIKLIGIEVEMRGAHLFFLLNAAWVSPGQSALQSASPRQLPAYAGQLTTKGWIKTNKFSNKLQERLSAKGKTDENG